MSDSSTSGSSGGIRVRIVDDSKGDWKQAEITGGRMCNATMIADFCGANKEKLV